MVHYFYPSQMSITAFKYLSPFIVYALAWISFSSTGWAVWLPLAYAWILVPVTELFISPSERNMSAAEEEMAKADKTYDYILYAVLILQYTILVKFLITIGDASLTWYDIVGRIWSMGLICGVFGINVGHELGHRTNSFERFLAKALLLTSQYMHFYIEHNKGHHKRVATPEDPSSARKGEDVYRFFFRSCFLSYISAWKIAIRDSNKNGYKLSFIYNEMMWFTIIQICFVLAIFFLFGWPVTIYYLASAAIGISLLETVNYIEHYGLSRKSLGDGKYERAMPAHSWNSNHVIGRIMLFELSRHSDHHYMASRKFQVLRHHEESPQMPTGYPGMMLLAMVPPLWFRVMDRKLEKPYSS